MEKTVSHLSKKDQALLKTYFSVNMSLKETAEQLFLHKNTLQYQLDKIWKNTRYNPREFKDATILYIALKLKEEALCGFAFGAIFSSFGLVLKVKIPSYLQS